MSFRSTLCYLMRASGMADAMVRRALAERAWDDLRPVDLFCNAVAVTIGRLRRRFGRPPVITTTPGVGYR